MANNNIINFRSEFVNGMCFSNPNGLETIKNFFDCILCKSQGFVLGLLWNMCYDHEGNFWSMRYLQYLPIFSRFSTKQQQLICSEIRYQYSQLHLDFLLGTFDRKFSRSYNNLLMVSNEVTAFIVYKKILRFTKYPVETVKRCYALLCSSKGNVYFGGIRELGFNYKEAVYLKPFIHEIHDLFKEVVIEDGGNTYASQTKIWVFTDSECIKFNAFSLTEWGCPKIGTR